MGHDDWYKEAREEADRMMADLLNRLGKENKESRIYLEVLDQKQNEAETEEAKHGFVTDEIRVVFRMTGDKKWMMQIANVYGEWLDVEERTFITTLDDYLINNGFSHLYDKD